MPQQALGAVTNGLDSDSAVERLAAEKEKQANDATPFTYPFNLVGLAHEMVDHIFREPFSTKQTNDHDELLKQAQEVARQCMSDMLSGNEVMRLPPDALQNIQQSLQDLTEHVTHEALRLYRGGAKRSVKSKEMEQNLRREIREKVAQSQPVKAFKDRYLGWAATIDKQRELGQSGGKETQ